MNTYQITLLIFSAIVLIAYLAIRYFKKDWFKYYDEYMPIMKTLYSLISAMSVVFPFQTLKIVRTVLEAAINATVDAEKLWKDDLLDKEQRNAYAKNYIANILAEASILVTPQIEQIIDGVIAIVCMLLPHEEK